MVIIVMVYIVVAPVRIAFATTSEKGFLNTYGVWEAIEALTLLVFFCDIVVNCNTAIKADRRYIFDRKRVIKFYLKKWFIYDVVAMVPYLWFT